MRWQDIKKAFVEAFEGVHVDWHPILISALMKLDSHYLDFLSAHHERLIPKYSQWFAAFSLPFSKTQYVLLGESPYPRVASANGYSFWDASVGELWGEQGLSTAVNRATSLRNLMKLWLCARGDLDQDCSKEAIQRLDKASYCQTLADVFTRLLNEGFLLLNASLVYEKDKVPYHAKQFRPFLEEILRTLNESSSEIQLILLGKIADQCPIPKTMKVLKAEHPYNLSFITNPRMLEFFKPFDVLRKI